jgi:hypothetical protein
VLEALSDETAGAILKESVRLPEREQAIVLGIVRQFAGEPHITDRYRGVITLPSSRTQGSGRALIPRNLAYSSRRISMLSCYIWCGGSLYRSEDRALLCSPLARLFTMANANF